MFDKRAVFPLSIYCGGEHGYHGICLALPSIVGEAGVERVITHGLDEDERAGLAVCAEEMNRIIGALKE